MNEAGIWFPYHIKDFRSETYSMTKIEKCCYLELVECLWENDGSIPADDKWIARELAVKAREWAGMKDRILRHFVAMNGRLTHPRISTELEKAKANIDQRRRAGMASAEARKAQRNGNGRSTGVATSVPTASQPCAGGGGGGGAGIPYPPIHEESSVRGVVTAHEDFPFGREGE